MAASETNINIIIIIIGGPVSVLWTSYDGTEDQEITNIIKSFDGSIYMDSHRGGLLPLQLSVYL